MALPGFRARWLRAKQLWLAKTGIRWSDYTLICKGALGATIGIALLESTSVAKLLGGFGYLVPVAAIIAYPMPPRGDFVRALFLNIITSCFAAALTMLGMYCVVIARGSKAGYSGTASAVAGVWLAFETFVCSAVRASYPGMAFPCSSWLVFSNFGLIYATQYEDVASQVLALRQLLLATLIGFAISTALSLLLFPTTSRESCFRTVGEIATTMKSALASSFCRGRSTHGSVTDTAVISEDDSSALDSVAKLSGLMSTLSAGVVSARREMALGKIEPEHLEELQSHLQAISEPLCSLAKRDETAQEIFSGLEPLMATRAKEEYHQLSDIVAGMFLDISSAAQRGIDYVISALELDSSHAHQIRVEESNGDLPCSGGVMSELQSSMEALTKNKATILTAWNEVRQSREGDVGVASDPFDDDGPLHILMYTQLLLWTVALRVLQCVSFANRVRENGELDKRRLILPRFKTSRMSKTWLMDGLTGISARRRGASGRQLSWSAEKIKDPCHLAPTTLWEETSDALRVAARFFESSAAVFAFRVTCATMCIAIIGLLRSTQKFYVDQHLVWAQYAVSFAMQPSTGQSLRHFIFRISGTTIAVVLAWIAWYIVDEHPAGAIAFYWIEMHFPMYIMVKAPRYMTVGTVSAFALTIVLGNIIQIAKFGPAAKSQGINPEPVYLLGAIRLAAICAGLVCGWFWSIFPYPLSEHERLRQTLGSCLHSVTRYYRLAYETIPGALADDDHQSHQCPRERRPASRHLAEMRASLYTQTTTQLRNLDSQLKLLKYDVHVGGRFPRELYEEAVSDLRGLLNAVQVSAAAIDAFAPFIERTADASASPWLSEVRHLLSTTESHEEMTLVLSLLSMGMLTRLPLPPFVRVPKPHPLLESLMQQRKSIFHSEHAAAPGYATLAVLQITAKQTHRRVTHLLEIVERLIGALDLSSRDDYLIEVV